MIRDHLEQFDITLMCQLPEVNLHADLCVEALKMALTHRRPKHAVLHHSDRGCRYAAKQYQDQLNEFDFEGSISRVSNCWDNAVVESLWAGLKTELVVQRTVAPRQQAKEAISECTVMGYNRKRRHRSLGYLSPDAFEAKQNRHVHAFGGEDQKACRACPGATCPAKPLCHRRGSDRPSSA